MQAEAEQPPLSFFERGGAWRLIAAALVVAGALWFLRAWNIHRSGTWDDDHYNWERAFGERVPKGVEVVHSRYWNSDHFTHEYVYFMEITATDEWWENYKRTNSLMQFTLPSMPGGTWEGNSQFPNWFAPGSNDLYEAWSVHGKGGTSMKIRVRKSDRHIFLHDKQL